MDRLTPEQRHKNMQNIKSKDTSIELILRRALREKHIGYRVNYKMLPGKPDIVLTKYHIVIFCDSEFFHGKDFDKLQEQLRKGENADFWINKISSNIKRDNNIDKELHALGWTVLHFWGRDIKKDPDSCIKVIEECIFEKRMNGEINV